MCSWRSDKQIVAKADSDRMGTRTRSQLAEQVAHVRLCSLLGDCEPSSDLQVAQPISEQLEHLGLTSRQRAPQICRRSRGRENDHAASPGARARRPIELTDTLPIAIEDLVSLCKLHNPPIGSQSKLLENDPLCCRMEDGNRRDIRAGQQRLRRLGTDAYRDGRGQRGRVATTTIVGDQACAFIDLGQIQNFAKVRGAERWRARGRSGSWTT
jgi:hypothetical protein